MKLFVVSRLNLAKEHYFSYASLWTWSLYVGCRNSYLFIYLFIYLSI